MKSLLLGMGSIIAMVLAMATHTNGCTTNLFICSGWALLSAFLALLAIYNQENVIRSSG